jgi:hypothetical protein
MADSGVGRLLVASLHQGIADLLPTRLEFYESWLNPSGLRNGRIGLAPLVAVLSFLRQEGEPYHRVAARAGEYTAEWIVADLPALQRTAIRAAPAWIRRRLALRVVRTIVRSTYGSSRALLRWRGDRGEIDLRGSVFCEVREPVSDPLCEFYAAATRRTLYLFNVLGDVTISRCRGTGAGQCVIGVDVRPLGRRA